MPDLAGQDLSESFITSGPDVNAPYTNSGAAARLTFIVDPGVTVSEGANAIDGPITLVLSSGLSPLGVLALNGANTYSGGTILDAGVLQSGDAGALGSGGVEFAHDATLEATVSQPLDKLFVVDSGASATFAAQSNLTLTLNGTALFNGGSGTSVTFGSASDSGTVFLAPSVASADAAGAVAVAGGTLVVGSAQAASLLGSMQGGMTVGTGAASATLDLRGEDLSVASLTGAGDGVVLDGAAAPSTLTVGNSSQLSFFDGVIEDGAGQVALHVLGGGQALILRGDNTYSGGTTIDAGGTLNVGFGSNTGSIVGPVADSGILNFERSDDITFAGAISGDGTLQQFGGTLTLSGDNSGFSGAVNIQDGALSVGAAAALGTGSVNFGAGSTAGLNATAGFNLPNAVNVATDASATIGELNGLSLALVSIAGLNVSAGATLHFGSATQTGAVDLTPGGANNAVAANSAFSVDGGFLVAGDAAGAAMLGKFGKAVVGTGQTHAILDLDGFAVTLRNLSGDRAGVIDNFGATKATLTLTNSAANMFAGEMFDGPGGLSVVVAGRRGATTFTGANHYTGGTTISLRCALRIGGTQGSIEGDVRDNGVLAFDRSNAVTFAGNISGVGSVKILGAGETTLSGVNTFRGALTLAAGKLNLAGARAAGAGMIRFAAKAVELIVGKGDVPRNTIAGLAAGDRIELVGVAGTSASINSADQLVVQLRGKTVAKLQLTGAESGLRFGLRTGSGGTLLIVANAAARPKADVADLAASLADRGACGSNCAVSAASVIATLDAAATPMLSAAGGAFRFG